MLNYFSDIMEADVYVLGPFLGHGITGDEYQALVITADGDWFEIVAELPHKGMHPDYLAAAVAKRHVFGFCGGERDCSLSSRCP